LIQHIVFFSPSTSTSTDLHISTDSGNIITENYKQKELISQKLHLLPKTNLSQYSETSKTFEHPDLPHIDNIVNIVDETDFNYFIKPRGKQNIQRFFYFIHSIQKKNDGNQLPFNTSKSYYVEIPE